MVGSGPPVVPPGTIAERGQALLGLGAFIAIAWLIGRARGGRGFPLRVVLWGVALQFAFGAIVLFAPAVLETVQLAIKMLLDFSNAGAGLVFGNLVANSVSVTSDPAGGSNVIGYAQLGFVFAFNVLPTIIFVSMLTAILYHLGVLTWVVHGLAWVMRKTMGCSGAETLSTAANIFVGQTEAPLVIRPFLAGATRSELMAIMVGGFANIATGVLVVYTELLQNHVANAGGHLALACFISAPATLVVAKLLMPEVQTPQTAGGAPFRVERTDANLIDAATRGTNEGLTLALNVAAMLIAFTALVALVNAVVSGVTAWMGLGPVVGTGADGAPVYAGLKLETVFGWLLAPLAWLAGVEWKYCDELGALLGLKTVLNEFLAYFAMNQGFAGDPAYLSPRAALLSTYALCGFANFASVGIQIGGISVLAPSRRHDLSRIGLLAMFGGMLATLMAASVVGVLV